MSEKYNPILSQSAQKPFVRPGAVIVAYDGNDAVLVVKPKQQSSVSHVVEENVSGESIQEVASTQDQLVGKLSVFGRKAAKLSLIAAKAGGKELATAIKKTSFGARIFNDNTQYFLVDKSKRKAEVKFDADSASSSIPFTVTVHFDVQVEDAAAVVAQGVDDIVEYHAPAMRKVIRELATQFKASELNNARTAFKENLQSGFSDGVVKAFNISLRVNIDSGATELMRKKEEKDLRIDAISAEQEVEAAQTGQVVSTLSNPKEILAAWLVSKDSRYKEIYQMVLEKEANDIDRKVQLLEFAFKEGILEPFEIREKYPQLAPEVLKELPPTSEKETKEKTEVIDSDPESGKG